MPLTVKDILEKTFKRSFKGYDEDEVDRFLDQVIDDFKQMQSDKEALKSALDAANDRLNRISETEATIMNTLVSAQKSSERMLAEAARKAELIIDSAQTTATRRAEQAQAELAQAEKRLEEIKAQTEKQLDEIKAHAAQFAENFANMINSQAASFDRAYRNYFGESEAHGGIAAEAARRIGSDVEDGLKEIGVTDDEPEQAVTEEPAGQPPEEAADEQPEALTDEQPEALADKQPEVLTDSQPEAWVDGQPEVLAEGQPEPLPAPGPDEMAEIPTDEVPQALPGEVPQTPPNDLPAPGKDLMSLHEINKALSELEDQDGNILDDNAEAESDDKPRYDDYSWLYDSDNVEGGDAGDKKPEIAGKDDETLKSLIDEIIE